jgi:hypothetical protein
MSTLAACRPTSWSPVLSMRRVDEDHWSDTALRVAVLGLGYPDFTEWVGVQPRGCEWDDLVNEVSGFGRRPVGSRLEAYLLAMAESSDECIVWYPGDRVGEIPVVDTEVDFAARIVAMVACGDIEPKLRFARRRPTRAAIVATPFSGA